MKNKHLQRITELYMERKYIIRQINGIVRDKKAKKQLFENLNILDNEIKKEKFELNLERRLKKDEKDRENI